MLATYVSIFLVGFALSNILCFVNVVMLMGLINNFLNSDKKKEERVDTEGRRSLNSQVYFSNCIELTQAIEDEIDK